MAFYGSLTSVMYSLFRTYFGGKNIENIPNQFYFKTQIHAFSDLKLLGILCNRSNNININMPLSACV